MKSQCICGVGCIILLAAFAACSSSSTEPSQNDSTPIPSGFARFQGTIKDVSGVVIQGAEVFVPFGQRQAWGGTTDSKGHYEFDARAADFAKVSPVAMIVFKDGYLPRAYYYTRVQEGATFNLTTDPSNAPRVLAANEFVPTNAYGLWHIGDDSYSGSANSQLQVATSGTSLGFPIVQWSTQLAQQYHSATVQLVARGVQSVQCPGNLFGVYAEGLPMTSAIRPSDSDAGGGFSAYRFTVPLPSITPGVRLMFGVISGNCAADRDDFEITQVLVTLND